MRTECEVCLNRFKNNRHCKKDDSMKQDNFLMCKLYQTDFTASGKKLEVHSEEFMSRLEERTAKKLELSSDFTTYLRNGGIWNGSSQKTREFLKEGVRCVER